jgi:alcohol dehydrogenase class IV
MKGLGMPVKISELGVTKDAIPKMAEQATRMAMIGINIRPASEADCIQVLESAM